MTEREAIDILTNGRATNALTLQAGRYILGCYRDQQRIGAAKDVHFHELMKFKEAVQATIKSMGKESMPEPDATQPRQDVNVHAGMQPVPMEMLREISKDLIHHGIRKTDEHIKEIAARYGVAVKE